MSQPNLEILRRPVGDLLGRIGLRSVVMAVMYFVLAWLSLMLTAQMAGVAAVWPPSGFALAALLLTPQTEWRGLLFTFFVANLLANLAFLDTTLASISYAAVNCAEAGLAAWLLIRFLGPSITFTRLREVFGLVGLAAVVGSGVAVLASATVSSLAFDASFWRAWWVCWVADSVGMLLVTPVIVSWPGWHALRESATPARVVECTVMFGIMVVVAQWVFGSPPHAPGLLLNMPYLVIPFLLWAATRLGTWGGAVTTLLLAAIALWNGANDLGPFADPGAIGIMEHVQDAQLFLSVVCVCALLLAAAIAERERTDKRARELQSELAHVGRLTMAGEMASGLAHELNQPLAAIMTYAETCQMLTDSKSLDRDMLHKATEEIVTQSQRASEIIRRMRNFTRKSKPNCGAVDINALIAEMARFAGPEARNGGVAVHLDLQAQLPLAWADGVQIQQVVLNLICNAIEAMEASPKGQRHLWIRTKLATLDKVEVAVSDTGPGLSPDGHIELFHPFSTTKATGMGLGLSISKTIIEIHSGRLWTLPTSSEGGATFCFTLPIAAAKRA